MNKLIIVDYLLNLFTKIYIQGNVRQCLNDQSF